MPRPSKKAAAEDKKVAVVAPVVPTIAPNAVGGVPRVVDQESFLAVRNSVSY